MNVTEKYYELLWAVEKKYPNETRYETALRFIKKGQRSGDNKLKKASS